MWQPALYYMLQMNFLYLKGNNGLVPSSIAFGEIIYMWPPALYYMLQMNFLYLKGNNGLVSCSIAFGEIIYMWLPALYYIVGLVIKPPISIFANFTGEPKNFTILILCGKLC